MNCPNDLCDGSIVAVGREPQPAVMEYLSNYGCYICPWCSCEVWLQEQSTRVSSEEARQCLRDELRQQNLMRKKTSSRKGGRATKEKKIKYQSWWVRE